MKLLFWLTLTANLLLELYAALNLLLGDAGLLADTGQNAWSIHYAFAAITIASVSIWLACYLNVPGVTYVLFGYLCTFHLLLFISAIIVSGKFYAILFHAFMAIASLALNRHVKRT